ncbi:MAG: hypothetical protein NVS1B7_7900 [Candidatus Saccharimonadales bacterium]
MPVTNDAKIDVLSRVLYMLEENSVVALTSQDSNFKAFMVDIYSRVDHKITDLDQQDRHHKRR